MQYYHTFICLSGFNKTEKLDSITNLFRDGGTFFWTAPFSLDLTNVEPDIVYCVDVYNITCGGRELLISDCDVTETSYTSDVIVPDGYIREYIVTPRSNVEGAVNGTSRNITGGSKEGEEYNNINNDNYVCLQSCNLCCYSC